MKRKPDVAYLEKVKKLSKEQVERLHSRMRNKLTRRTEDEKMATLKRFRMLKETES